MGILVDYDTLFRLFIESTTQQTKNIFLSLEMVLEVMYNIVTKEHLEDILFNSLHAFYSLYRKTGVAMESCWVFYCILEWGKIQTI